MPRSPLRRAGVTVPTILMWPLLAVAVVVVVWGSYEVGQQQGGPRIVSAGPRIEDVRRIAKLAVLRVQVADVIEGQTGRAKGIVLVRGDADIAVDLDRVRIAARDDAARTATIVLPKPRPERPRVDHSRTRVYELRKVGLAAWNPLADPRQILLEDCMGAAQQAVARAVAEESFVVQAQRQAELMLAAFYRELGWSIAVQWE